MAAIEKAFNVNIPSFHDTQLLDQIQQELHLLPPLVHADEVSALGDHLVEVFHGQAFVIQMGDCAERFSEATQAISELKCRQLIHLKSMMEEKIRLPVISIGRMAGQYAKPRSAAKEMVDGKMVYSYYGDMMNEESLTASRNPNPHRLLTAYHSSRKVLSHIAAFKKQIYTSHECFLLEYEQALSRSVNGIQYNLSTHLPWLGMRNIQSEAHINYLSSIGNPVAIKIGATTPIASLFSAIRKINPKNRHGKIILICRLGVGNVSRVLPKLIEIIHVSRLNVIWMCDPLHGNTKNDPFHKKYRLVSDALEETLRVCDILHLHGMPLGGLHLETSYREDILECVSSRDELTENRVYDSALDPRLNAGQCIHYIKQVMDKLTSLTEAHHC